MKFLQLLITAAFCFVASGQLHARQKGTLTGTLTDSAGKQKIVFATITVFHAADTSIITYRLSDDAGIFKVPGLPLHKNLRAVITATGYEVYRKEFMLSDTTPELNLGQVRMQTAILEMDEVLVVAERPPVVVRKDTIEFNASAFKTLPTALVEDLLKKLPGVEVDREGNITVNGRKVNRMLVDGKEFFGSDPKVASKNLPANLIDKVQVSDDQEELLRNPDLSRGETGQVINLKLRKSIKQGWFGKLYAGAGTSDRYEAGGIVNLFRDTLQVSLLGYTNNLTRTGFGLQDVMNIGGFNRTNINGIAITSDGGFSLNGISFGGMGQGIQSSSGAGINANTVLNKKTTLSLQYFYGRTNSLIGQRSNTRQFFNDTTLTIQNSNEAENTDYSHRISGFLRNKPNSNTTIEYRPSFTFSKGKGNGVNQTQSGTNFDLLLNESINDQSRTSNGMAMSHDLSYNKSFKKKGRSLFTSAAVQLNKNDADQYNTAENTFYKAGTSNLLQQLRTQDQDNWSGRFYANYNEPLSAAWSLRFTQTIDWFNNKDYIETYEYDPSTQQYSIPDAELTNGLKRDGLRSSSFAGVTYKYKKLTLTPGMTLRALHIENNFQKNPAISQRFLFLLPALNIRLDKWNLNYTVNVTEPAATDLQPVVNNTNPLFLQLGNPSLNPSVAHSIGVNAFSFDMKSSISYSLNLNGTINKDAVIRQRTVDENGVQVSMPVNTNGVWRGFISGNIRKQYKFNKDLQSSVNLNVFGQYNRNLVLLNANRSNVNNFTFNPGVNASLNWKDKIEVTQRYSPSWSKSTYEEDIYPGLEFWRHTASTELVVRMPRRIVWETTLDYTYNPQVADGMQKNVYRWNAGINFLFLKQDKGQLKLSVYDLLNQNNNISRSIRDNYIRDTETLVLRRYFLLTFTYNLRDFKAAKVGGRNNFLFF